MSLLASSEKKFLLDIARQSLISAVLHGESPEELRAVDQARSLPSSGGAFVTLRRGRRLRGCIGQMGAEFDLPQVVSYCAKAAALNDPRFAPVAAHELREIEIELSILSKPMDVSASEVQPGKHGLIVSNETNRGLLLPQVASEYGWSAERFLEETCVKGGMDSKAWRQDSTRIQVFTAEVFSESSVRNDTKEASATARNSSYSSST